MTDVVLDEQLAALRRRYGTRAAEQVAGRGGSGAWNDVIALQLAHRSVRKFLPEAVSEDDLCAIVAAASSAASSSNLQLWSVVAVTDRDRLARIATFAGNQPAVRDAPLLLVWVADLARAARVAEQHGKDLVNVDYVESALLGVVDAALAAQNAVLAAESLGLGTVYIGAIRNHPRDVAAELALPDHSFAVVGLVVGRPDPEVESEVKPRLGQDVVLHREQYSTEERDAGLAAYEEEISGFYRDQGLAESWVERVLGRFASPGALGSREQMREALRERGFGLD
ncbi:NADPH-dependent oxidoreductase [Rhodococcus pyridinivorans]|uniref:NADPH-dependent oxidoreductase n=1 Tax=Rhodococcus pyridinivorans TaxID=103816 RepID=UPI000EB4165C|nr:NADPH-dependent oxidoreductase [Rhodococcus pyridinivorans]QXF82960.1 NADPH-dependent oxidoreductase [Rhodococcus pyridinivorans]